MSSLEKKTGNLYLYIYKSRSLNEVLPRQVKSLSRKMTRIELKFKIPYGAIREILFQTATHLSFKKKKKKTQDLLKRSNRLFTEQTGEKKKKASATKTLKPKSYFPTKIHTHSDYRFLAVPSNTQIGLACSNLSNRRKKKSLCNN